MPPRKARVTADRQSAAGNLTARITLTYCSHLQSGLSDSDGGFQQKLTLTSTTLNALSWSRDAASFAAVLTQKPPFALPSGLTSFGHWFTCPIPDLACLDNASPRSNVINALTYSRSVNIVS